MADFKFIDHSDEVNRQLDSSIEAALEAIGNQAVSHAKNNITEAGRVDTGALRNSISHKVESSEKAVYVGTNVEYAIYNEFGTGIYAEEGRGRKTPWSYVDEKGQGHFTHGMRPIHFLKRAAQDHAKESSARPRRRSRARTANISRTRRRVPALKTGRKTIQAKTKRGRMRPVHYASVSL